MLIYTIHSQDLIAKKCHLVIVVTPFNVILIRLNIIVSLNWHVPSLLHLLTFPEVSLAVEDAVRRRIPATALKFTTCTSASEQAKVPR